MTSTIKTSRRGRALVGTVLASAASVVGMIAVAAPAQAADQYIAVALGYVSENPPVLMAGGSSINGNQDQAFQGALSNCVRQRSKPLRGRGRRDQRVRSGGIEQITAKRSEPPRPRGAQRRALPLPSCRIRPAPRSSSRAARTGTPRRRRRTSRRLRLPRRSWGRRSRSTRSSAASSPTSPTAAVTPLSAPTRRTTSIAASGCLPTRPTT